jgi:hypothetical protein
VQRGSPESKSLDGRDREGDDPANATARSPAWSRVGGLAGGVYRNSLSLVLLGFFGLSMIGHLLSGTAAFNEEQALQSGAPPITAWQFLATPEFWFQSMQNWQSEFVSVGCLVVLSIVLRQHGYARVETGDCTAQRDRLTSTVKARSNASVFANPRDEQMIRLS